MISGERDEVKASVDGGVADFLGRVEHRIARKAEGGAAENGFLVVIGKIVARNSRFNILEHGFKIV